MFICKSNQWNSQVCFSNWLNLSCKVGRNRQSPRKSSRKRKAGLHISCRENGAWSDESAVQAQHDNNNMIMFTLVSFVCLEKIFRKLHKVNKWNWLQDKDVHKRFACSNHILFLCWLHKSPASFLSVWFDLPHCLHFHSVASQHVRNRSRKKKKKKHRKGLGEDSSPGGFCSIALFLSRE